jgi:hypothetical protein
MWTGRARKTTRYGSNTRSSALDDDFRSRINQRILNDLNTCYCSEDRDPYNDDESSAADND